MSTEQLEERSTTIDVLSTAGWTVTSAGDWFDRNLWANQEATCAYDNGRMRFRVEFCAENRTLNLRLEDSFGRGIALNISYQNKLKEILDAIVSVQDTISEENYRKCINELLPICPELYVLAGPQGTTPIRLVDDDLKQSPRQLQIKKLVLEQLTRAGWEIRTDWEGFEKAGDLNAEAQAVFSGPSMDLRLSYFNDGWLRLEFIRDGKSALPPLRLQIQKDPSVVVDLLIAKQSEFSLESYPDCLKALITVCDQALLETDDGMVRLSL